MCIKRPVLILLSICMTGIINHVLDDYVLMGLSELAKIQVYHDRFKEMEKEEADSGSISRKLSNSFKLFSFMSNFSSLSRYGSALTKILFGSILLCYFGGILLSFWTCERSMLTKQLLTCAFLPRSYIILIVLTVINVLIVIVFVGADLKDKGSNDDRIASYDQFIFDYKKISSANLAGLSQNEQMILSANSLVNIRHSVAKLKSIIYLANFSSYFTVFNVVSSTILIIIYSVLDMCL